MRGEETWTDLLGVELEEDVVALSDAVLVGPAALASSLEVLSADEAAVDVDRRQADRTQLLKVKVEQRTVDLQGSEDRLT